MRTQFLGSVSQRCCLQGDFSLAQSVLERPRKFLNVEVRAPGQWFPVLEQGVFGVTVGCFSSFLSLV